MLLEIKNVFKQVTEPSGEIITVSHAEHLMLDKGGQMLLTGPSGSGKSTLIRCVNFLEQPTGGVIAYRGQNVLESFKNLALYRTKVGMVFQQFNLFNNMTVLENCMVGQVKVLGKDKDTAHSTAMKYLEHVGMASYINAKPHQLSGGQKQRVAIARAMAMEPEVLLLDEPTSALDPEMVKEVLDVIKGLANTGITMVLVTHEMGFARDVSDVIHFMDEGYLIESAPPLEFFANPKTERARKFLSTILS